MPETIEALLDELAQLDNPKIRAVNVRHGDDHGVNLAHLRAIAKRLNTQHDLATQLWDSGDTAARLLSTLVCSPKSYTRADLDLMAREAEWPKVLDWLVNYVVKKSAHKEDLRTAWLHDDDPNVASAGWVLTTERVKKTPTGLDLDGILDTIEHGMKIALPRPQWAMNETLANIGICHAELRERAIAIGENLQVLKDYPTPPNCTSPYAPAWIAEIVRRQQNV